MACGCQFSTSAPIDLLRPYPAEEMKAWKVGRAVGNTRNNDPVLVEPLLKEEPGPLRLFD
jgi:putative SOS response-associated peptidase YedK